MYRYPKLHLFQKVSQFNLQLHGRKEAGLYGHHLRNVKVQIQHIKLDFWGHLKYTGFMVQGVIAYYVECLAWGICQQCFEGSFKIVRLNLNQSFHPQSCVALFSGNCQMSTN